VTRVVGSICSTKIGRRGKVWSCSRCHILLHSTCLDGWYRTKVSASAAEGMASTAWPCPGCMYLYTAAPKAYTCFCGKVTNPEYNAYVTPHSCGGTCGKNRGPGCTHPCTMYVLVDRRGGVYWLPMHVVVKCGLVCH
jgi:transcriptional repressor NF-X1